jgi:hypothetical protein
MTSSTTVTTMPGPVIQTTEVPEGRPPLGSRVKGFASRLMGRDQGETVTVIEGPPMMSPTPAPSMSRPAPAPSVAGSTPATPAPIQKVSTAPAVTAAPAPGNAKIAPVPASASAPAPAPANARAWPPAYADQPASGHAGTSYADNPIMSMSPPSAGAPAQKNRMIPAAASTCDCQPTPPVKGPTVASTPCQCTPCQTTGPVIVQGTVPAAPQGPGLRDRVSSLFNKNGSGDTVTTTTTPAPKPVLSGVAPPPAKVAVEAPKITDWRQSWGQLDTPKTEVAGTPKPDTPKTVTVSVPSKPSTPPAPVVTASAPAQPSAPVMPAFVTPTANVPKIDVVSKPLVPVGPPVADSKRPDPLKDPEIYVRRTPDDAALVRPVEDRTNRADRGGKMPMGTQSVAEAGSPQYVPVPIVTVPDYRRVPEPPPAHVPQAPEPNRFDPTNAFTNPAAAAAAAQPQAPVAANAFTNPPAPVDPTVAAGGAFGGMGPGSPPMGMYPPGYGPRMPMMGPPAGYYPMPRGMYPPMPYGPAGYPTNPAMVPAGYAPAPMAPAQPVRQASYQVAMANPSSMGAPVPPSGGAGQPSEAMATLRDSIYPSQREWAAGTLSALDWHSQPDAVHALVTAAREDPAPTVRAACVRALAKMHATSAPVLTALQGLKTDGDPRVLHEVEAALAELTQEKMAR